MPYSKGAAETDGVSPKAIAATLSTVATYLLGQQVLELPVWAQVICQVVVVAAATWAAPPGRVTLRSERGLTLIEALVVLLIVVLLLVAFGVLHL